MFLRMLEFFLMFMIFYFFLTQILLPAFNKNIPFFWIFKLKSLKNKDLEEAKSLKETSENIAQNVISDLEKDKEKINKEIKEAKVVLNQKEE